MSKRIILNSQCLPKKSFHCGNAVSGIISEIFFLFFKEYDNKNDYYFVSDSWNLHGLPFEDLYKKERMADDIKYEKLKFFAEDHVKYAQDQKKYFSLVSVDKISIFEHYDTDQNFIEYTVDKFHYLFEKNKIIKKDENYNIDIVSNYKNTNFDEMNVVPSQHKYTIINDHNMIGGYYPITKNRIFTPSIELNQETKKINPIFQSFIYPIYVSEKYDCEFPTFLFVSSFGHGMLKWHYLRNIISFMLKNRVPYKNLILHGNILGLDKKRMSKHGNNIIQPSDLYKIIPDRRFVRHVLIRSISNKDLTLQIDLSFSEFRKIKDKLDTIESGDFYITNLEDLERSVLNIKESLNSFDIKKAFDIFYSFLRKNEVLVGSKNINSDLKDVNKFYKIFYGPYKEII